MSESIPPERDVKLLLQKYQLSISQLRGSIENLESVESHDDTWILRYLMSAKGDVSHAEAAIIATLKWRAEKTEHMQVSCRESHLWHRCGQL